MHILKRTVFFNLKRHFNGDATQDRQEIGTTCEVFSISPHICVKLA